MARSDLFCHIQALPLANTHSHLRSEADWTFQAGDPINDLIGHYLDDDLLSAGMVPSDLELIHQTDHAVERRWESLREYWHRVEHTGYGEPVRHVIRELLGADGLDLAALRAMANRCAGFHEAGQRTSLLRDMGRMLYVQIDPLGAPSPRWTCMVDDGDPVFFLYDLSWVMLASGQVDFGLLGAWSGREIRGLADLEGAYETIFEREAGCAIAVKTQHAYRRTLAWVERDEAEVVRALDHLMRSADHPDPEAQQVLGDWSLAQACRLCAVHDLPLKIHTGYAAGNGPMELDNFRPSHLCGLLDRYRETRFVLMHGGLPYTGEFLSIIKHFPHCFGDLCWAWSVDPLATSRLVMQAVQSVPSNKLFGFGDDTYTPIQALGYSLQARHRLADTMQTMVDERRLSERDAMRWVEGVMHQNQARVFDIDGTRQNIQQRLGETRL